MPAQDDVTSSIKLLTHYVAVKLCDIVERMMHRGNYQVGAALRREQALSLRPSDE